MARDREKPIDIVQINELHGLLMGDRPGGGMFRKEPVQIRGASHKPPDTWEKVMQGMKEWEEWSRKKRELSPIIRAAVLHAWLSHVHPYIDGNGRTARAVSNLELMRAGYPPIIIKKKERDKYIQALSELAAREQQGYQQATEKIKKTQENDIIIWERSVALLAGSINGNLIAKSLENVATVHIKEFEFPIEHKKYIDLVNRRSIAACWCFIISVKGPRINNIERLAYIQYRQPAMFHHMGDEGGPSIFWFVKNPDGGYPVWVSDNERAPYCTEMTIKDGIGDKWYVRLKDDKTYKKLTTTELAENIAGSLMDIVTNGG